nr:FAD-binding oxidoreductase [Pararoseomonas baculiformis]
MIARGNGRSYGDAAIGAGGVLSTLPADRILAFDADNGSVTCEAGLLLADLLDVLVPRGWFVPVTPGTKFVTLGGMMAADVHGKNHHGAGSFGDHVLQMTLLMADGSLRRCSPAEEGALFAATRGGMGLTGVILDLTLRLIPIETSAIRQETRRAPDLGAALAALEETRGATYAVAWIDCQARGRNFGRSLIYVGEHATRAEAPHAALAVPQRRSRRIPLDFPAVALNRWSIAAFNELYWRSGRPGTTLVDYDSYFYPLDAVLEWNRIYGRRGFVQYQCVLPYAAGEGGMAALLRRIVQSRRGSFLAVLKLFGPGAAKAPLSFPMEGWTLALDFPADADSFNLLLALDAIVTDHGGRLYLAKDARMGAGMLRAGYPQLDAFRATRAAADPGRKFRSLLSQRLDL